MRAITVLCMALLSVSGCAGVRQLAALHQVEFRFDRIADPHLSGIKLSGIHSLEDISPLDLGRLALGIAAKDVPLDLTVHVVGKNPETNSVVARLVGLDWSYLIDKRELASGRLTEGMEFPPGKSIDVPVRVTVNLVDFFGTDGKSLVETALALTGQRTATHSVTMRLQPVIETSMGPVRYPVPIDLDLVSAGR